MPGYIDKLRARYNHDTPEIPQHSPYQAARVIFGAAAQEVIPDDTTAKIDKTCVKATQQVAQVVLYYARAVDLTVLTALNSIASEQTSATEKTGGKQSSF